MPMFSFSSNSCQATLDAISQSQAIIEFKPDGTILTANANFLNTMGYALNEIRGKHHSLFVDRNHAVSPEYKAFWQKLASGHFEASEFLRFDKNGREIWIQASYNPVMNKAGKVEKVVKIATDITEQKRQHADFAGQIKAINRAQAVIQFKLDGTITDANDNFLQTVGYTLDEIKGHHHSMFVDPQYRVSDDYSRFWKELADGYFKSDQFRRFGKNGREIWINAFYNPIFDSNGKPFKVVKFATDITEQVREQQRRAEVRAQIDKDLGEIAHAIAEAAEQASHSASTSEQTSFSVQTVAAASEELVASIQEISRQVQVALDVSRTAIDEAERSNKIMSGLSDDAKTIGSVVELIDGIADQTNLLALNATIEAARAGEAGKGFAVVASEVKGLASQTSKATEEIYSQVNSVQGTTESAVEAIAKIMNVINNIGEIAASISSAVEEQSSVTNDISSNMQSAAQGVDSITASMQAISSATSQINTATQSVQAASISLK